MQEKISHISLTKIKRYLCILKKNVMEIYEEAFKILLKQNLKIRKLLFKYHKVKHYLFPKLT